MLDPILQVAFAAVIGACFGSFANVLAIRLHTESSLLGRSSCPACNAPIRPQHLVPIFSWLALRGTCADCNAKIHIQYPLVEVAAACLAVIAASHADPFVMPLVFAGEFFFSLSLLVMVVMDIRWQELPLELMGTVGVLGALVRVLMSQDQKGEIYATGIALLAVILFFGAQWAVSKGKWLGSGDIWFAAMMAGVLGWPLTGIGVYLAYLVGGSVVLLLFILRIVKRGTRVPFAPALALGTLLAMWFGPCIQTWLSYAFAS